MLPKQRRLSKELVKKIIKEGKGVYNHNLSLKYLIAPHQKSAFSFVVPAKIEKLASRRNKLKRMARAGVLKILPRIKENRLAVVFFRGKSRKMKFSEIEEAMVKLFREADLLI